jgi:hypothetical protein
VVVGVLASWFCKGPHGCSSCLGGGVCRIADKWLNVDQELPGLKWNDALGGLLTCKLAGEDAVHAGGSVVGVVFSSAARGQVGTIAGRGGWELYAIQLKSELNAGGITVPDRS